MSLPPGQAARLFDALKELGRPPTLTAPRAVIREAVLVAIDETGDAVARRARACCAAARRRPTSCETVADLGGLLDLLETI